MQVKALIRAEMAAEASDRKPFTKEEWIELASEAYEPSLEPPEFRGPKDTEQVFKKGKDWNDLRSRLHTKMLKKVLDGKPGKDEPTLIILGGGPASGKSFLRAEAVAEYPSAVVIDPDEFKSELPEYETFRKSDPLRAAARVHEESSYLAATALEAALLQGNDVILDVVSGNPKKVAALIQRFREEGYLVHVRFVDAPFDVAMKRMAARAKSSGRWVPPDVVENGHIGAAATFFEVNKLADTAQIWSNTNGKREKVAKYSDIDVVYNSRRLEEYRKKADQYGRH